MDNFKIFSTFTGAGGLDIGFHGDFEFLGKKYPKLNFETICALEYNNEACLSLKENKKYFNKTTILEADITKTSPREYKNKDIDVLLGGFPCVTFSMSGSRLGIKDDLAGQLYKSYSKFVKTIQPKIFLAENVKGILSANKGEAIKVIVKEFEKAGYKVKYKLINFADFGVPQKRERVIFIGIRNDLDIDFEFPNPIITDKSNYISVLEAFKDVEKCPYNNEFIKQREKTINMLNHIPEGGNFKDLPPNLIIKASQSNIYRRLDRNIPSYTVLASGGGGTWTYHYEEPRALTNRERARLQSFPDDYKFIGSITEVRRQIGNAVPPVGIYYIAKEIEKLLKKIAEVEG
jgi:DNA (cytosine-5)-methyltransferase 1